MVLSWHWQGAGHHDVACAVPRRAAGATGSPAGSTSIMMRRRRGPSASSIAMAAGSSARAQ
jgi:hypothetical protein